MAWTRLRSRWRDLLAPTVADRVDVHAAGYRRLEHARRVWLTLDGKDVLSCCSLAFQQKYRAEYKRLGYARGIDVWRLPMNRQRELGVYVGSTVDPDVRDNTEFLSALAACVGSSAAKLLSSPDPLVRALAMLDRRVGSRRLSKVPAASEHRWVQQLHSFRCDAEVARPQV